jgi:predicted dehydrogenase
MKLKVGIAGYGVVGKRRRMVIDQNPSFQTVAVCDQNFRESGTMADGVRYHRTYDQLLQESLDVLFVSLPNYLAADVTIAGLEKDLHVFCEKPPGRDVADVQRVIDMLRRRPECLVKYGFNHRYHGSVRHAQNLIMSGELGEIVNMRGVYGKSKIVSFASGWRAERGYAGGGILLDQGIHMVDLMRLFCGEFEEVKSYVSNSYWNHDVEDNVYALLRDTKGRVAMLHSSATQWQHKFSLDIALTQGFIELKGILSGSKSYGEEQLVIGRRNESDTGTAREEIITYLEDESWSSEIDEFADAITKKADIVCGTAEDALKTMELVYRIYSADPVWREAYGISDPKVREESN